jgi:hypothetical protein
MSVSRKLNRIGPAPLLAGVLGISTLVTGVVSPLASANAQTQPGFADPAFYSVWERTDRPVAEGKVARTWVWGPTPGRSLQEAFKEGPNGQHLVQYFDKARMEINNPNGNRNDPYFVTNGLLVVEMISGKLQTGVNSFETDLPADQRIAGDDGSDAPTYAALQGVASVGIPGKENRATQIPVGATMPSFYINKSGAVSNYSPGTGSPQVIKAAGYVSETGHNIADVFYTYFNSQGPVYQNGQIVNGPIVNWISAFGFPVTEPYWTTIRVGGQDRVMLFQAFQRRIVTYSPNNQDGWKVEMGNVGAQYYSWRYETPSLTCQRVPVRGFGRVWADHSNVQAGLGCPLNYPPFNSEMIVPTAYQPFEHGAMLWVSRTTYTQERLIYAFFNDGTFQQFDDTWREGQPVSGGLTPPTGLYEPVRGFGKVWREGTGARVRERLGWATGAEKGANGAYQRFEYGEMYWSGTIDKIWVLYGTVYEPASPQPQPTPVPGSVPLRYEVYDDTY